MAGKKTVEKKKTEKEPNACIHCGRAEGAVHGSTFTSNGENGMIITFWMCEECAIPLGPGQGPITLEDPTTRV